MKHRVLITMDVDLQVLADDYGNVTPEVFAEQEAKCLEPEWLDAIKESLDEELGAPGITFTVTRG